MQNPRTIEYLYILRREFGNDLCIDATECETEWGTTHYHAVAFFKSLLLESLPPDRLEEFKEEGIGAILDCEYVFEGDTLDEAITRLFAHCYEHQFFYERVD